MNIVEPCNSPWASPVVLVKQGDKMRFCVDYRKLNSVTKKDQYPLPRIDDILTAFSGKKWFSTFDANKGFHQISVKTEEDMDKLAFRTHCGQHRFKRMPFGVCNGPSTFQRLTDLILGAAKWDFALVYIDDIIVFSATFEEHCQHIAQVLEKVAQAGLTLSLKKSAIAQTTIKALGHTISNLGIGTTPANIDAVRQFPPPQSVKELQRFLGMAVYYRAFIKDFARIAAPLHKLTKKDTPYTWEDKHQQAYQTLKDKLTSADVLAHPNYTKPFILYTDACIDGFGAILSQIGEDGKEHPICYISRQTSPAERNYSITELECGAVVWSLKKLHPYLAGAKFKLVTDHSALQWLYKFKGNNSRLARWMLELQPYKDNMDIVYRPGRKHSNVDPLSRAPLPLQDGDDEDTDFVPSVNLISTLDISASLRTLYDRVAASYVEDAFYKHILDTLLQEETLAPHLNKFSLQDKLIWRTNRATGLRQLCIPDNKEIRLNLLHDYHDAPISGHLGQLKTYQRLSASYWWPKMAQDINEYVRSCTSCQMNKSINQKPNGVLNPIETQTKRWHAVTMDFTGPLPTTKSGHNMLMVVVDKFTKRTHLIPTNSTDTAPDTAQHFFHNIVRLHGLPKIIISDRDAKFTSLFWKSLFKKMGVKLAMSTAYHPQTDGQTERANRTIKEMLRHYISFHQDDWIDHLDTLEYALNDSVQESTGLTPFELDLGYHPLSPLRLQQSNTEDMPIGTQEFLEKLGTDAYLAQDSLLQAQGLQAHHYNSAHKEQQYKPGDQVRLSAKHIHPQWIQGRTSRKLQTRYYGPFTVKQKVSEHAYLLDLPTTLRIHPVINIQHLAPFNESPEQFQGRTQAAPPPIDIDGEEEYLIKSILNHRIHRRQQQFLVQWEGYADHDSTWLPLEEVKDTQALEEYLQAHPELVEQLNLS